LLAIDPLVRARRGRLASQCESLDAEDRQLEICCRLLDQQEPFQADKVTLLHVFGQHQSLSDAAQGVSSLGLSSISRQRSIDVSRGVTQAETNSLAVHSPSPTDIVLRGAQYRRPAVATRLQKPASLVALMEDRQRRLRARTLRRGAHRCLWISSRAAPSTRERIDGSLGHWRSKWLSQRCPKHNAFKGADAFNIAHTGPKAVQLTV
jgi:hypothetical protein